MKPTLVIAGPGAGKTHDMVNLVAEAIPQLDHCRFLAVITFTNAATESIRSRIFTFSQVPPNVFVGTTFSFFNRFIIQPYASIFENIEKEKLFLDIDISSVLNEKVRDKKNHRARSAVRKQLISSLYSRGKIPISEIGRLAATILQNDKRLREVLCNRLQYLFIDEFQDIETWQFKVFDEIRKGKKTSIYAVGDPEQYIMGFTYQNTTARKPKFNAIPIQKFNADRKVKTANHRSYGEIVKFTNRFHTELDQETQIGNCVDAGVYYIDAIELDAIIQAYRKILAQTTWHTPNPPPNFFYLARENKVFGDYASKYDLSQVSAQGSLTINPFKTGRILLSSATGMSSRQLAETYGLSRLKYRELGVKIVRGVQSGHLESDREIKEFIATDLGLRLTTIQATSLNKHLSDIQNYFLSQSSDTGKHQHSSIHRAKGLQADGVLAVAKSDRELISWLTTDKEERRNNKSDRCREGYVAFTRAKQVLCIACQKEIGGELLGQIKSFGVQIIEPVN